jgi:signal peptidase I
MRRFSASILETAEVIVVALGAVFLIRSFLVQPFLVSGASMIPSFSQGDYLLIDELSYYFREPRRGEVVVFRYPNDESTYFIKRIIGLPGERVVIKDGRIIIINREYPEGKVLAEPYLPPEVATTGRPGGKTEFNLSANQYLVLGDNRSYSFDSRDWGVLARKEIVGIVRLRLWPISGLTVFAAPNY